MKPVFQFGYHQVPVNVQIAFIVNGAALAYGFGGMRYKFFWMRAAPAAGLGQKLKLQIRKYLAKFFLHSKHFALIVYVDNHCSLFMDS
jgi:hypothetical protein